MISKPAQKETADTAARYRSITDKPYATWLFPCFLYAVGFSVNKRPISEEDTLEMLYEILKLISLISVVSVDVVDFKVTEQSPCVSEYSVSSRFLEDTAH